MKKYFFTLIGTFICSIMFASGITTGKMSNDVYANAPVKIFGALATGDYGRTPTGIYSFDAKETLELTLVHRDKKIDGFCNGTYIDGKFYAFVAEFLNGILLDKLSFIVYDAEDWSILSQKPLEPVVEKRPTNVFYNPANKKMYAYINSQQSFFEVNRETGALTKVCEMKDKYFNMFAVNAYGQTYASDSNGDFYILDLDNAAYNYVGNTKFGTNSICPATFDPQSGRMFMTYCPTHGSKTKLVEIDPNTGVGTEIGTFPKGEIFTSLFIKGSSSIQVDKIPSEPTSLSVIYKVPGKNDATLKAVAPTLAFDNKTALKEAMTVRFYVDNEVVGEVENVAAGTEASSDFTFESGYHLVKVEALTTAGAGPAITMKTFAGFDTPKVVNNLQFAIEKTGDFNLTWEAPELGINNGEIDKENIRYQVISYPGKNIVAESQKETSFSGKITSTELKDYYYGVIAICGDKKSEEIQSNHNVFGEFSYIPYVEDFSTSINWPLYSAVDYNEDGCTWIYDNRRNCVSYLGNKNPGDDFLFTPAFKLQAYVSYTLTFGVQSAFNQKCGLKIYATQSKEIPYGGPSEMNKILDTSVEDVYGSHSITFTPTENGIYYFAFQCETNPNHNLFLKDLNIMASSVSDAPGEVTDFKLIPGEKGKVEVTASFKAPTTYVNGDKLPEGGINAIYLYRGEDPKPIHIFDHPANGEALSYLDTEVSNGIATYSVLTLNDNGNSESVEGQVWVGEDFAMSPQNFQVRLIGDSCVFTWSRPIEKGFHNGYVDMEKLTYNLSFIIEDVLPDNVPLAYGITDSTYTVAISEFERFASKDRQISVNFTLSPVTSIGDGVPAFDNCIIGKAYDLPFAESFANNDQSTYPWGVVLIEGDQDWYMVGDSPISKISPYDNDGGMAMYYQKKEGVSEGRLQSPNISIEGVKDPVLEFYMFHRTTSDDENNYLQVEVVREDGSYVEVGEKIAVSGEFGWKKHEISLKSLNEKIIRLSFKGRASEGVDFYIDNISLMEKADLIFPEVTDLKGEISEDKKSVVLSWSAPAEIGNLNLIGYYVYCDGKKVSEDYTEECTYTVQFDNKEHTYAVSVVYNEGDSPLSNEVVIRPTGIEDNSCESVMVYVSENAIHIENAEGLTYQIFDLTGKQVEEGLADNHSAVYLEKGIYLVRVKDASYKCIVL